MSLPSKRAEPTIRPDKAFLRNLFGIHGLPRQTKTEAIRSLPMATNQIIKGLFRPFLELEDKFRINHGIVPVHFTHELDDAPGKR